MVLMLMLILLMLILFIAVDIEVEEFQEVLKLPPPSPQNEPFSGVSSWAQQDYCHLGPASAVA